MGSSKNKREETESNSEISEDDFGPVPNNIKNEEDKNDKSIDVIPKSKVVKFSSDVESEIDNEDDYLGPVPTINKVPLQLGEDKEENIEIIDNENEELLKNLPNTDFYECSFMHKKQVSHIVTSSKTGFIITASIDGIIKFWKINFNKNRVEESNFSNNINNSIEYVKGYQAHKNEISDLIISNCGLFLISISKYENNYKLFNVINFDMISIVRIPMKPNKCVFITPDIQKNNSSFVLYPEIAISDLESNNIYIIPSNGHSLTNMNNIPKYVNHKHEITSICYLPKLNIVISSDMNGSLEFWDPRTMALPKIESVTNLAVKDKRNYIRFRYKIETDLFELQKNKSYAINMAVSNDEKLLAIYCSDTKIRIFNISTGKCIRLYDESISTYNNYQNDSNYKIYHLDHIEFGIRSTIENEILNTKENSYKNICFDESSKFLIFSSMIGINILDVVNDKRVSVIGKMESGKRFLSLGVMQIHRSNTKNFNDCDEKKDSTFFNVNSIIVSSSFKSNRIYVFSRFLPLLENGEVNLKRDIFNEPPTLEELERQKQIEKFASKNQSTNSNKRIAKNIILHTTKGDITVELLASVAPKACENFTVHCFNGYYDNCIFHRVIKGFMIQSGDPTGDGTGGQSIWDKEFEDEISPNVKHDKPFILSMANAGPNTNGSQFFITTVPCPWLDGIHTIFGRVIQGKEYVQEIEHVKTNQHDKPVNDVFIVSTSVIF